MRHPKLRELKTSRSMIDTFRGYNRDTRIRDGEFRDMENLSSDCYPALSVRKGRSMVGYGPSINTAAYIPGKGLFYTDDGDLEAPRSTVEDFYQRGEQWDQQLVQMGAYMILVPEMRWINTITNAFGEIDEYGSVNAQLDLDGKVVTFSLCREDGTLYEYEASSHRPDAPADQDLWMDLNGEKPVLKRYSSDQEQWVAIPSTYVRISAVDVDLTVYKHDGVTISGIVAEGLGDLNGSAVIRAADYGSDHESFIVIPGLIEKTVTQDCAKEGKITIERKAPEMDFVVEAGNRLWGCRYGRNNAGEFVNEIYASKLGDFKNWNCFMGISTDSWVASVGTPGPFTGAANIGGNPVFYKENVKHKVWISANGGHQVTTAPCHGVQTGCHRSVAGYGGGVVYRTRDGFCVDDGGTPQLFGTELGKGCEYAAGCVHGDKYYVSMRDSRGWHLFVYDFEKKLWHREDDIALKALCSDGRNSLYAVTVDGLKIVDLLGGVGEKDAQPVRWMAETGELGLESADQKYISRLTLRLSMEPGAELTVYAQYDMEQEWVPLGSIRGTDLRSFSLPIRPRRCDHLRLKFEGEGNVKLYSITKTIEEGSEIS